MMDTIEGKVLLRNMAQRKETTQMERIALEMAVETIIKMEEFVKEKEE